MAANAFVVHVLLHQPPYLVVFKESYGKLVLESFL